MDVKREVKHLKRLLRDTKELTATRLKGMDKALKLLQAFADKSPTTASVGQAVKELEKLHEASISFVKEAAAEQKANFTKQLDALESLFETTTNGLNDKIDALKDRLTVLESRSTGRNEVWGYLAVAGGLVLTALALFVKH